MRFCLPGTASFVRLLTLNLRGFSFFSLLKLNFPSHIKTQMETLPLRVFPYSINTFKTQAYCLTPHLQIIPYPRGTTKEPERRCYKNRSHIIKNRRRCQCQIFVSPSLNHSNPFKIHHFNEGLRARHAVPLLDSPSQPNDCRDRLRPDTSGSPLRSDGNDNLTMRSPRSHRSLAMTPSAMRDSGSGPE